MSSIEHGYDEVVRAVSSPRPECLKEIAALNKGILCDLFTELTRERLVRKQCDIDAMLRQANYDWNQTLIMLLFRVIGGSHNKLPMTDLANITQYVAITRESNSLTSLEALLLGNSGLLDLYDEDSYVRQLREEHAHLVAKYRVVPMSANAWKLRGMYIHNHPTLRLAQIAALLHKGRVSVSSVMSCLSRRDVYNIFSCDSSQYWSELIAKLYRRPPLTRRIGQFKCDIIGINLVAPLIFTYGVYINSAYRIEQAIDLLNNIPTEDNNYIKLWHTYGTVAKSAFDSQALIQLTREYCENGYCDRCPLYRKIRK